MISLMIFDQVPVTFAKHPVRVKVTGTLIVTNLNGQGTPNLRQLFLDRICNILRVFSDPIKDARLAAVEPREANEIQTALC